MRTLVAVALVSLAAGGSAAAGEGSSSESGRLVRFYAGFAATHVGDERPRTADRYDRRRVTRGFQAELGVFATPRLAIGVELLSLPRVESEWSRNEITRSWTGEEELAISGVMRYAVVQWRPLALEVVGGVGGIRAKQRWEVSERPYYYYYGDPTTTVRWRRHSGLTTTAGVDLTIRPDRHVAFGPVARLTWVDVDRDAGTGERPAPLGRSAVRWSVGLAVRARY